jgi:hypothetical protein
MTRLPRLKGKELVRLLGRIGFGAIRTRGNHGFLGQNKRVLLHWIGLILLLAGCRHNDGPRLIDGFVGYETIEKARAHSTKLNPGQVWTEEKERVDPTDRRPPHSFVHLLGDFRDLGSAGKLRLTFYNNRLMTAEFWPSDGKTYLAALRGTGQQLPTASGQHIKVGRGTDFCYYADADGTFHFIWEDPTLTQEWLNWVAKYS